MLLSGLHYPLPLEAQRHNKRLQQGLFLLPTYVLLVCTYVRTYMCVVLLLAGDCKHVNS